MTGERVMTDAWTTDDDSGNLFLRRKEDGTVTLAIGAPSGYLSVNLSPADQARLAEFVA